jgi:hypothetical protein
MAKSSNQEKVTAAGLFCSWAAAPVSVAAACREERCAQAQTRGRGSRMAHREGQGTALAWRSAHRVGRQRLVGCGGEQDLGRLGRWRIGGCRAPWLGHLGATQMLCRRRATPAVALATRGDGGACARLLRLCRSGRRGRNGRAQELGEKDAVVLYRKRSTSRRSCCSRVGHRPEGFGSLFIGVLCGESELSPCTGWA